VNIHEKYIKRCIELAKNGLGTTFPNPLVGAVLVHDNKVIGEGWHQRAGDPHAEVIALKGIEDRHILSRATLYVNLEPCSHYGKTPPCTDLIIKKGISKVVIGTIDVNSKVCGKGVAKLRANNCQVIEGVLENECNELNKRFFTFHTQKRPYVILKWAISKDGFMDKLRNEPTEVGPNWITTKTSRQLVHKMRSEEQAILIGTRTAMNDNPSLNVRDWSGNSPIRLIIDRRLEIPENYNINDNSVPTLIFTAQSMIPENKENTEYIKLNWTADISKNLLKKLYERGIQSVLVEGGLTTLQQFIDNGIWDEAHVFSGAKIFTEGLPSPIINETPVRTRKVGADLLRIFYNNNQD
jgi:diaminohydroxyphosphoribosylaminopyrimidine deaminase/5-amino-6-(5-phosphoribosylamino)uracil reductase